MTDSYITNKLAFRMRPKSSTSTIVTLSGENGLVPFTIPRTSPNRVIPSQTSGRRRQKTGRTDSVWSVTCDWNPETKVIAQYIDDVWEFQWRPAGPDFPATEWVDSTTSLPGNTTRDFPQALGEIYLAGLTPGADDNGGLTMSFDCEMTGKDIDWSDQV